MCAGMWGFAAFISLFYVAGFGVLGFGLWSWTRSVQAGRWPITTGTIESSSLKSDTDGEGGTTYQVQVKYSYAVAGVNYVGDRLAFGYAASGGGEAHDRILKRLQTAEGVDVRYDPGNPSSAVLSYGVHRSIQLMLAFGATWLALVTGFTILWWLMSGSDDVLLRNLATH